MILRKWFTISAAITLAILVIVGFSWKAESPHYSKTVRAALRGIGHQLLLQNQDSSSWVMPIQELGDNQFEISFPSSIKIIPDSLVSLTHEALSLAQLPSPSIVEVKGCADQAVYYSFQIFPNLEQNDVPCLGRDLPPNCYTITITFLAAPPTSNIGQSLAMSGLFIILCVAIIPVFLKKDQPTSTPETPPNGHQLGNYFFDLEQHQLQINQQTIDLSAKEFELLSLLSQHPNQVISRDRLLKEIWEDKGVFVGRSLDMFISKLRKKLKQDDSVKISNVRGVGYKLEVM
ncbi:MAG: winged helix-turn-helix domain-containing protein [Flammeovirgaceae bacterium]